MAENQTDAKAEILRSLNIHAWKYQALRNEASGDQADEIGSELLEGI
ncbi:MAG: hypothetical protein KAT52_05385 [Desulfobacterales bacterium]|nr:hypothetical protein [Desulfobacterales bacterium]